MLLIFAISQNLLQETFDGYPNLHSAEIITCKLYIHPIWIMVKLGIKINLKQNALSGSKLLSRDSGLQIPYETHMNMCPQATMNDCKH